MRYRTYTLRIEASDDAEPLAEFEQDALTNSLQHAADVVNDALPDGYYCKIDESGEGVDLAAVRRLEEHASLDDGRDVQQDQLRRRLGDDEYEYLRMEAKIDAAEGHA